MVSRKVFGLMGFLLCFFFAGMAMAATLKIATISPEGSMWMEKMKKGAEQVEKETEKRVTMKFYPGGVMGNDSAVLRKIRIGQLQGGAFVAGSLSQFFPANQIYAQPFKFQDLDEVDHLRQFFDPYIIEGLDKGGFVVFGIIGGGFAYVMSKEPIQNVQDLRNRKVWIPDNDQISQDSIKVFGITPVPLPISDVRTSLQTGLIDTIGTSPVGAVVLQWYSQVKYVMNIPLIYLHAVLAIDKTQFMKIDEADRQIISRVMTTASKEIDVQNRKDDIEAIETLKSRGIVFTTPPKQDLDEWYRLAGLASLEMTEAGVLPKDIADKINGYLNDFHSKKSKP
ncbi:MAG: TRAP transporter substrate-binding protein DctP [Desulfobacula sp.]